ncbi:DUF6402 family protein [Burkholderia sp. Ac-20344]|uniref:DUF6402 family protein n=1 Tax=Burkholderia sp. Ac-20344 TaxID=2703890 RepID=UPI001F122618|nr:DUF6402 family protein [Burkholderia sp. Ac-20344]
MGWPISAKLAREWLASPRHIYNNDLNAVQPLDDTTVSLGWALKFRDASDAYDSTRTISMPPTTIDWVAARIPISLR